MIGSFGAFLDTKLTHVHLNFLLLPSVIACRRFINGAGAY
jgi:hypothetical protein